MGEKKKSCALNFFFYLRPELWKIGHWKTYRRIRLSETQTSIRKSISPLTVAQKGGLTSKWGQGKRTNGTRVEAELTERRPGIEVPRLWPSLGQPGACQRGTVVEHRISLQTLQWCTKTSRCSFSEIKLFSAEIKGEKKLHLPASSLDIQTHLWTVKSNFAKKPKRIQ